ncbi:hypothetical protein BC936DRAFT_138510 [Jimgerdemannia flammicorona]|uniref:Uncharacterized protein n=1 Tax=Jimgerdemannia flammicorona TaxID=994334 RepID=A0A433C9F3_9FUNG|nr:hypothetical protein BC936DRAFT_138510 [Jimgerdemannia flammicorona]
MFGIGITLSQEPSPPSAPTSGVDPILLYQYITDGELKPCDDERGNWLRPPHRELQTLQGQRRPCCLI